ncbi:nicotinate-nucleotide--dimethylbenzimidazole phosphoribosyltransferase [Mesorhizobium xinjiangense]|uniref:nicotinate-nucleotide--dimethylbenzimidazole phosphoribosyltransferase n=1 Tax=Mesorhizobium xinjiangense TaxID=2678685 RepID=UPI0012EE6A06|nr:nicotinate-nucleotide--dimethylbenzimidazole phosphoribosyltransferase [Mesorhizobium xinjiangense]
MTATGLPFDDFRTLIADLPGPDPDAGQLARNAIERAGGDGVFGRLGELAAWYCDWSGRSPAVVSRPLAAVFAGNHGVAARGVSVRPQSWTSTMVEHCTAGGAAVNQACVAADVGLKVFDLALDIPTGDISREAALDERACAATMAFGMEAVAGGADLLCIGSIGVAGSTVAAAVLAALYGGDGAAWVDPGLGAGGEMQRHKAAVVDEALAVHSGHLKDPLETLRRLGGREFAAIAGAILAARIQRIPVILDGFAATASAALLKALDGSAIDHCILAAVGHEPGHARAAERLGLRPVLDFGSDLGAGAEGALAAGVVKAAAQLHAGTKPVD